MTIGKDPRPSQQHQEQVKKYCDILLPALREVAGQCGYAIAVHGSLQRDIDLVAIPWREMEMDADYLVEKLTGVVNAIFTAKLEPPSEMPHGRRAWIIRFCAHHYIDLSVMPRVVKPTETQQ